MTTKIVGFLALIIALVSLSYNFQKQDEIAFVNSVKLVSEYKDAQISRERLNLELTTMHNQLDTLQLELNDLKTDFNEKVTDYSEREKNMSIELISTKEEQFLQYRDVVQQQTQEKELAMLKNVQSSLNEIVQSYAKSKGLKIVFGAAGEGNVVYADSSYDITDDLLKIVNQ